MEREQAAAAEREAKAAEREAAAAAAAAAAAELEEAVAFAEAEEQESVRRRSSAIAIQRSWIRTTTTHARFFAEPGSRRTSRAPSASLGSLAERGDLSPPSPGSARDLTV